MIHKRGRKLRTEHLGISKSVGKRRRRQHGRQEEPKKCTVMKSDARPASFNLKTFIFPPRAWFPNLRADVCFADIKQSLLFLFLGRFWRIFWSLRWHPWSCNWVWCQNKVQNNRRSNNSSSQTDGTEGNRFQIMEKLLSKYQQIRLLCVFIIIYSTLFWYCYWSHLLIFQTFGFLKHVFAVFWRAPYKYYDYYYLKLGGKKDLICGVICRNIPRASLLRKDAGSGLVPSWEETKSRRWVILIKASRAAAPTPDDETSAWTRLLAAEPHFFTLQISAESVLIDARLFGLLHSVNFDWLGIARGTKTLSDSRRCRFTSSSAEPKPSALINRWCIGDVNISKFIYDFMVKGSDSDSCVGESGEN